MILEITFALQKLIKMHFKLSAIHTFRNRRFEADCEKCNADMPILPPDRRRRQDCIPLAPVLRRPNDSKRRLGPRAPPKVELKFQNILPSKNRRRDRDFFLSTLIKAARYHSLKFFQSFVKIKRSGRKKFRSFKKKSKQNKVLEI